MDKLTTSQRIRKLYGSEKAAIQHCIELKLSLSEAAEQLQCSRDFLRVREKLYKLHICRKKPKDRRPGERTLPKRTVKGRVLAYLEKYGIPRSDPEAHYRAEVYAGMRGA